MRGFPFLNLLLALLISGAVMLPLVYRATRAVPPSGGMESTEGPAAGAGGVSSYVSLRFVHAPVSVRLKNGEAVLHEWAAASGERLLEETVRLPVSENRVEFLVQIIWPDGTPDTAVEITVEPDGKAARTTNVWSSGGTADELVTLTWEGAP